MRSTEAAGTERHGAVYPNRRLVRLGLVPAAALAASLGAASGAGASAPQSVVTTAKIAGLGTVLVASHRPLYEMANGPKGQPACSGVCAKFWKPLIVSHNAAHHLGHVPGLGTIHRSNGTLQAAIHGHALFFFVGDHSQSHASGQGVANIWFTVKSNGTLDRTTSSGPVGTVPPTSQPGSSTTSPSTTRPTSPAGSPAGPVPTSPPPTAPPTTSPPPPPPTTTTPPPPPTTTTTTSGGGGGVGF